MSTDTAVHPYRNVELTSAQLHRLPMWARLEIARLDATICRAERLNPALLAALKACVRRYDEGKGTSLFPAIQEAREAIRQAEGA